VCSLDGKETGKLRGEEGKEMVEKGMKRKGGTGLIFLFGSVRQIKLATRQLLDATLI